MFKRITAAALAVALGAALSLVGASAAQAHTADFNVTAVCNTTTGNYDLTGHLTLANVPSGVSGHSVFHVGTQSFSNNWNGSTFTFEGDAGTHGNGTVDFALPSIPGTTVGTGPWTYVYTTFNKGDTVTIKSDNQATGLDGTCNDTPDSKKITFCHYDEGQGGKYTSNNTSVSVFFQAGHLQHSQDIFPAGSYTKNGVTHTWAAQGDQSLLQWNDCLAVNAAASISVSTPTCQSASVAAWTGLSNATGGALDQTPGTHSGVATATAHHAFPAGPGVNASGTTETISYTIVAATSGAPCWPADATASVTVAPPTCSAGSVVTATPEAPAGGSVTTSGPTTGPGTFVATFTAPSGHKFPAGPNTSADGSTYTITVQLLDKDTTLCPAVVPEAPVVKDLCGTDNDHYGLPSGPTGVTYTRDGKNIIATLDADLQWGVLPTGWVLNQDGTASYAFSNTQWTDEPCQVPSSVSHTNQTCVENALVDGVITVGLGDHVSYVIKNALSNVVPFDATTGKTAGLAPGTYSVTATAGTGYVLNPDATGDVDIAAYGDDCGQVSDSVAASASVVGQTCFADEESSSLIGGVITVDVSSGGINYTITSDSDAAQTPIPYNAATGKTGPLNPGSYTVVPAAKAGFVLANPGSIPEIVTPYDGICKQLVTHAVVDPSATQVQLGCQTAGSYTLTTDQLDPSAVLWTVNGSPVGPGTYKVTTASTVHVTAAPDTALGFGFAGDAQHQLLTWDFTFKAPATCDLTTLALTGTNDGTPMLAASALFLLLGAALVRMGVRQRRQNAAS